MKVFVVALLLAVGAFAVTSAAEAQAGVGVFATMKASLEKSIDSELQREEKDADALSASINNLKEKTSTPPPSIAHADTYAEEIEKALAAQDTQYAQQAPQPEVMPAGAQQYPSYLATGAEEEEDEDDNDDDDDDNNAVAENDDEDEQEEGDAAEAELSVDRRRRRRRSRRRRRRRSRRRRRRRRRRRSRRGRRAFIPPGFTPYGPLPFYHPGVYGHPFGTAPTVLPHPALYHPALGLPLGHPAFGHPAFTFPLAHPAVSPFLHPAYAPFVAHVAHPAAGFAAPYAIHPAAAAYPYHPAFYHPYGAYGAYAHPAYAQAAAAAAKKAAVLLKKN